MTYEPVVVEQPQPEFPELRREIWVEITFKFSGNCAVLLVFSSYRRNICRSSPR